MTVSPPELHSRLTQNDPRCRLGDALLQPQSDSLSIILSINVEETLGMETILWTYPQPGRHPVDGVAWTGLANSG